MTRASANDEGTTLLELLIAIAILGVAVVALVGGMFTAVLTTDVHRKLTKGETLSRDYAEAAKGYLGSSAHWARCPAAPVAPATVGFTPPAGYSAASLTVQYWVPSPAPGSWTATCPSGTDDTVQLWTMEVDSVDGRSKQQLQIVVRKP